ncbi:MAG: DUF6434 domain-containing protein, partial [Pseudomonadota bacterium]
MEEARPEIQDVGSGDELRRWYWLKAELEDQARALGLSRAGSKAEIASRIAHFLDTGEKRRPKRRAARSDFDWAKARLTPQTIITDSYRNGPNVRAFFKAHYGPGFSFNIAFMEWMRANVGKTLADAVEARRRIAEREKTAKPAIPEGNQFNAYVRAFHAANPGRSPAEARVCWAWRRARPGSNAYEPGD